jgi:hypothetical protein
MRFVVRRTRYTITPEHRTEGQSGEAHAHVRQERATGKPTAGTVAM